LAGAEHSIIPGIHEHRLRTQIDLANESAGAPVEVAEAAVKSPADGCTLLLVVANNAVNATLYAKCPALLFRQQAVRTLALFCRNAFWDRPGQCNVADPWRPYMTSDEVPACPGCKKPMRLAREVPSIIDRGPITRTFEGKACGTTITRQTRP
jgi:hypothetical protein